MYIVELNDKNIEDVAQCYMDSWKNAHNAFFTPEVLETYTKERFIDSLKKDRLADRLTFISYDKNNLNGFVTVDKNMCAVTHLFVCVDKQRQGIGTKLLEFGIKQLTNINRVNIALLSVNEGAIKFFENYGFAFTGEQRYLKNGMLELKYSFNKKSRQPK